MVPPSLTASSEARYLALSVLLGLVTVSSLVLWLKNTSQVKPPSSPVTPVSAFHCFWSPSVRYSRFGPPRCHRG